MDREINRERVLSGLASARKRNKIGGRPKGLSKRLQKLSPGVASMWKNDDTSIKTIRQTFNIAQGSVYKCLEHEGIDIKTYRNKNTNNKNAKTKAK